MTIDMELNDKSLDKIKVEKRKRVKKEKPFVDKTSPEFKKKKKKRITIIIFSIFLLVFIALGFLIYKGYLFSQELGFNLSPQSLITKSKEKELKKDSTGKFTNTLLVGLDTRESGGLLNTDTVILASYNHETDNLLLISIPRDFHVEVSKDVKWFARINSIYNSGEQKKEGSGIKELQKSVERLTGQEIQYYALVDFKSFIEIIDAVEGVDVNVENSFTDYMYPKGLGYTTVSFKAGPQTMDGETALIYSRSRHSQQNSEGTDFARARRQQRVIIALKDKVLSSESLLNPKILMNILSSISGNIRVSEFTVSDIEAAFKLAKRYEEQGGKTYSFVLDPSIGANSLVERVYMESGAYAIGPSLGLGQYDDIIDFIETIKMNPSVFAEDAKILVYDTGMGFQLAKEKTEELQEAFPYTNITYAGTLYSDKDGVAIYSNKDGFQETIKAFAKKLITDLTEKPEYINSNLNTADVTILLGNTNQLNEQ